MTSQLDETSVHSRRHDRKCRYKDDADAMAKVTTLESIDRLGNHLPQIVIDQIISNMEAKKEEQLNSSGVLGHPMTLDVPMVTMSVPSVTTKSRAMSTSSSHSYSRSSFMNRSLASLEESLDELFDDDQFSDSSSDSCCSFDLGSSSDDEFDCSQMHSPPQDASVVSALSLSLEDLEEEESISSSRDKGCDETDDESDSNSFSDSSSEGSSSEDYDDSDDYISDDCLSPVSDNRYTGSVCGGGTGSICSANASSHMHRSSAQEVGKLRQGRLSLRRKESDSVMDDRSMSVGSRSLGVDSSHGKTSATRSTTEGTTMTATKVDAIHHESAILFVDISGFTVLSQSMEVEVLSKVS